MYSDKTKLKEFMMNPFAYDMLESLLTSMNLSMDLLEKSPLKLVTLGHLKKHTGKVDPNLQQGVIDLIDKLNSLNENPEDLPPQHETITEAWWKEAVAYQIYPRSFKDGNGDGIGDLKGIISKLDYLKELGIDLLWLSPIYDSPNDDNGYDIRNYQAIMEEFGTMEDFDELLKGAHDRGIRLIMDLVINHSSDEHEWFKAAKESKDSPYRDYYIWREPIEGKAPNNWTSFFSGSAWEFDDKTGEYYMHLFTKKQADLNWDHQPMREDLYKMIRWWLDKGIDGFRLDVINFISKEDGLPDGNTFIGEQMGVVGGEHYVFGPRTHEYFREMRRESFSKYDVVTVGETPGVALKACQLMTHEDRRELDMVFNFDHLENAGKKRFDDYTYDLNGLKKYMIRWQSDYGNSCWNSLFFENHDNPRFVSKVTKQPRYYDRVSKLLAVLQLTLKGTPFIYQGQEIGMVNGVFKDIDEVMDVESINLYKERLDEGVSEREALAEINAGTRDHARMPVQWSSGAGRGFSEGTPWLKMNDADSYRSVAYSMLDQESVWHAFKELIELRKAHKSLVYGDFKVLYPKVKDRFVYIRENEDERFMVEMNLSSSHQTRLMELDSGKLRFTNVMELNEKFLLPFEVVVYQLI